MKFISQTNIFCLVMLTNTICSNHAAG